jgi:hypothetical protein
MCHKRKYIQVFSSFRYGTVPNEPIQLLPPLSVLAIISTKNDSKLNKQMSTELISPEAELDVQEVGEDKSIKDIEQEIECPRCYDVMTLSSNFDSLGYVCQECDFLLVMK